MSYEPPVQPEYFNPCPHSTGLDLFEHWETQAENDFYLIGINSTPYMFGALEEGDFILKRRWAPAGLPTVYNQVKANK